MNLQGFLCNRLSKILVLWCLFLPLPIKAFSNTCKLKNLDAQTVAKTYDLAVKTADFVDKLENVEVLIIARSGQNLSKYGLNYSHLGFLVRSGDNWQVIHLLNGCNTNTSNLYQEGLVNFIADTADNNYGLKIGVLNSELQKELKKLLEKPAIVAHLLHQKRYSAIAYPFKTDLQNSNGWVLEVLAVAIAKTSANTTLTNRKEVLNWLKHNEFSPTILHAGIIKRLGAKMFVPNIATQDHPFKERLTGNYSLVTVESVFDFLSKKDKLEQEFIVVL